MQLLEAVLQTWRKRGLTASNVSPLRQPSLWIRPAHSQAAECRRSPCRKLHLAKSPVQSIGHRPLLCHPAVRAVVSCSRRAMWTLVSSAAMAGAVPSIAAGSGGTWLAESHAMTPDSHKDGLPIPKCRQDPKDLRTVGQRWGWCTFRGNPGNGTC